MNMFDYIKDADEKKIGGLISKILCNHYTKQDTLPFCLCQYKDLLGSFPTPVPTVLSINTPFAEVVKECACQM